MRSKAGWALVAALAALAVFGAAAAVTRYHDEVRLVDAVVAAPVGLALALVALVLARRARREHERTLGRVGSRGLIAVSRFFATVATLVAVTAVLSLAVFAVLVLVSD